MKSSKVAHDIGVISDSSSMQNSHRPTVNDKDRVIKSHSVSSKQSPTLSQDSDMWHSESEANWTMVENPLRDITQSQILSEGELKDGMSNSHSVYSEAHESKNLLYGWLYYYFLLLM